jgi:hypothetical protein
MSELMIDYEFYRYHLERTRRDTRLSLSDRIFYECFVNILDLTKQEHIHAPMRTLIEQMNLSMGAITNAIPRLIEFGYIRGGKYPNERNLESWRLYLLDLRLSPAAQQEAPKRRPLDMKRYTFDGISVTITVEQEAEGGQTVPPIDSHQ